ncbi:uncharacterized protein LOC110446027 [Mizuhopecten yessoensis]|uniref:Interleukin 17-like protein n=1 Tax=Mizuhopecten yessoensis TaxID=6573 RepID=A0A210QY90_MIZYE|nr:uncharacterized protein LOC110446027 [Mizuhopecten yessoensis]OWF53700.1 Interleukin 17-like protein [Mizuhopecten yessoensis]
MNPCLALAVIVSLCMFSRITGAPVSSVCQNLTPEEEQKMLADEDINTNFNDFFLPQILTGGSGGEQVSLAELLVQTQTNYSTHCPTSLPSSQSAPVFARSSCPWFINIDNQPDRHPTSIPVAVPRCSPTQSCVGISEDQKSSYECERVYMSITVLRKVHCTEKLFKWVKATERVAVGTTCVRVKEVQSSTSNSDGPPSI